MNFAADADELHRQELARLAAVLTPRPEQFRSMNIAAVREQSAGMWQRLDHDIITTPDAAELVTVKGERKFITICGNPNDPAPAGSAALRRLRDRIVAASAYRGFYISVRGFTAEALQYAETAPVQLLDCQQFIQALQRSRKGMVLAQTYKAMCRQCGDIVQHRLSSDEAKRCGSGHLVAPTIARGDLIKPRSQPGASQPGAAPALGPLTRREIRAHNHKVRARAMRQWRQGAQ
jgi:Restriction endonuclease